MARQEAPLDRLRKCVFENANYMPSHCRPLLATSSNRRLAPLAKNIAQFRIERAHDCIEFSDCQFVFTHIEPIDYVGLELHFAGELGVSEACGFAQFP